MNLRVNRSNGPGPGDYDHKSVIGKLKYDYSYINSKIISEHDINKDKEKDKELEQINILKNVRKKAFIPYYSPFRKLKNSANYIFQSSSPSRDWIKLNDNPGPCYYQPALIDKRSNFNMNLENKFVV